MTEPIYLAFGSFAAALVHAVVLTAWRDRIKKAQAPDRIADAVAQGALLSVTCVVPARNAAATLTTLLQDLYVRNVAPERMEVIVVDDHSEDGTVAIVQGMMRMWPQLRCVANKGVGKKAAISTGVEEARGEIILLTDADARCGPLRTKVILEAMGGGHLDLLIMPVLTKGEESFLGRVQEEEQAGLVGMALGEALLGRPTLAYGANLAFTRAAFNEVGGYSQDRYTSGDDVFLVQRMKAAGKRIGCLAGPDAMVTVEAERTWSGVIQQRLRWAGKMRGVHGPLVWLGALGLLLPWMLLWSTCQFEPRDLLLDTGFERMLLLLAAWLLWSLPVVVLVREVKRSFGLRRSAVVTFVCYVLFTMYAPIMAVAALFITPHWKGRRMNG